MKHEIKMMIAALIVLSASVSLNARNFTVNQVPPIPSVVVEGAVATAFYTITNNSEKSLSGYQVTELPANVTQDVSNSNYCPALMSFAPNGQAGDECTIQLDIAGTAMGEFAVQKGSNITVFNSQPINVTQVSPDHPGLVPLSCTSQIDLTPGGAQFLTVTNLSSTDTAYDVNVYLPASLVGQIFVVADQGNIIPPLQSIDFSIIASNDANFSPTNVTNTGSNTIPVTSLIELCPNVSRSLTSITFAQPGVMGDAITTTPPTAGITVTANTSLLPIGVSLINSSSQTTTLPSGEVTFLLHAIESANGNGCLGLSYTFPGGSACGSGGTFPSTHVTVDPVTLVFNPDPIIAQPGQSNNSFYVENTGNFDWQAPDIGGTEGFTHLSYVCSVVAPEQSCVVTLDTSTLYAGIGTINAQGPNSTTNSAEILIPAIVSVGGGNTFMLDSSNGTQWGTLVGGTCPPSIDLTGMTYSAALGLWIDVGNNGTTGTILTSTDGYSWTTAATFENTALNAVATNAGTIVAVGKNLISGNAVMYYSNDGVTWTASTTSGLTNYSGVALVWSNVAYFTAVFYDSTSNASTIMSSADGNVWDVTHTFSNTHIVAITSSSTQLVVVGFIPGPNTFIAYSNNASEWNSVSSVSSNGDILESAAYNFSNLFVAGSANSNTTYTSSNGITWTRHANSAPSFIDIFWSDQTNQFIGIGTNPVDLYYGTTGTSWTEAAILPALTSETIVTGASK